jgi:hypothetical protein
MVRLRSGGYRSPAPRRAGVAGAIRAAAIWAVAFWLLGALPAAAWQESGAEAASKLPDANEINAILRKLSEITGFRIVRQLPFQLMNRDQINVYIRNQIKHSVRPKDIYAEELSLKKLGFVTADFDLKQTTIDLLTEQAAAFYDFHKKKLFISEWAAASMRDEALVHELAHALADQNFNIERYMSKGSSNADASLARQTVVEGQATWLTLEYAALQQGKTLKDSATAKELFSATMDPDDPQFPVFSKAPLYLRATMLFPYQEGQTFQQAVIVHDGQSAFGDVFRTPPAASSQILHPERYFRGDKPVIPELPSPVHGSRAAVSGVFGEEDMRVMLRQYTSAADARALPRGFAGGAYRIDERKKDHHAMLVFVTEWTDENTAAEFLNAYQMVLKGKWKVMNTLDSDGTHLAGKGDDGHFRLERKGKTVLSREGFAEKL